MKVMVIDANIGVGTVIPLPYSTHVLRHMKSWRSERARIVVPVLWHYEVVSALQKAVALRMLTKTQALSALDELQLMNLDEIAPTPESDRRSLEWAQRLSQLVAYDAQYLALTENLAGEFWTADRKLVTQARQLGYDWVHWIED